MNYLRVLCVLLSTILFSMASLAAQDDYYSRYVFKINSPKPGHCQFLTSFSPLQVNQAGTGIYVSTDLYLFEDNTYLLNYTEIQGSVIKNYVEGYEIFQTAKRGSWNVVNNQLNLSKFAYGQRAQSDSSIAFNVSYFGDINTSGLKILKMSQYFISDAAGANCNFQ